MSSLRAVFGEHGAILHDRRFQVLILANLVYPMGAPFLSPLMDSLQGPFDVSASNVGLLLTTFYLPTVFVTPFVGAIADRVGRKPVLVGSLLLVGGAGVVIPATTSFSVVLALRFVQGIGAAGVLLSIVASLGDFYAGEAGVTAQGVRMTFHSFGTMVLPFVAGLLIAFGWQYPFYLYGIAIPIAAIVYVTPGLDSAPARPSNPGEVESAASEESRVRELVGLLRHGRVLATLAGMVLPGFFLTAFLTYTSIVVSDVGGTAQQAGILIAVFGLSSAISASQSGRLATRFDGSLSLLLAGNASLAVSLVLLGLAGSVLVVACSAVAVGFGFGLILAVYRNSLTRLAPDHLRGGLTSFGEAANAVGLTTPPVVMGFFITALAPGVGEIEALRMTAIGFGIAGGVCGLACAVAARAGGPDAVVREPSRT